MSSTSSNEYNKYFFELKMRLSQPEIEGIFGTTDIGMLDCSYIEEDLYYCPTCQRVLDLTEIDSCMNTPNEIVDYCLVCQSEVINLNNKSEK
jgi:hypothetical protein